MTILEAEAIFLELHLQTNDYVLIDSYVGHQKEFHYGYVHFYDGRYLHLCDRIYEENQTSIGFTVMISHILKITKIDIMDFDLGL